MLHSGCAVALRCWRMWGGDGDPVMSFMFVLHLLIKVKSTPLIFRRCFEGWSDVTVIWISLSGSNKHKQEPAITGCLLLHQIQLIHHTQHCSFHCFTEPLVIWPHILGWLFSGFIEYLFVWFKSFQQQSCSPEKRGAKSCFMVKEERRDAVGCVILISWRPTCSWGRVWLLFGLHSMEIRVRFRAMLQTLQRWI